MAAFLVQNTQEDSVAAQEEQIKGGSSHTTAELPTDGLRLPSRRDGVQERSTRSA
jgi:hypothetical protein